MKRIRIEDLHKVVPKLPDIAKDLHIPQFSSDEEEVAWLDANHERLAELTAKHGVKVKLILKEPTRLISLRLPVQDIEHAQKIAARNKEQYQAVLKRAVRNGLKIA